MMIKDQYGKVWNASLHGTDYRKLGPVNQDSSRARSVRLQGKLVPCVLGNPQQQLKNGQRRGGTRVNIKLTNEWWHITQSDQTEVDGIKPNLYELMAYANKTYSFTLDIRDDKRA